ncbi:hypothetical protein M2347_003856 [Chryseobacterium sp. H1D6B]|uniref:GLPGLI family protein n=1 Tax=Chryseobacterium sp. H1D6B TaxID=2940588 RepID=UPI0015C71AEB|nr:GLPGLI family protein [Chryseobacterium sp. H1D6B]MDH6254129.1 hypothetical protein [Chryseobacterium sp. H1D6B]
MTKALRLFLFSTFFCSFSVFSQNLVVKYRFTKENNPIVDYELNIIKKYSLFYESEYCLNQLIPKSELIILKDKSPAITIFDKAGEIPVSTNKPNQLNWIIKDEKKTIEGYKSQRAEVNYKGRQWVAWFTNDLPFQDGPFIFNGLPGLILTVESDEYKFDLLGISKDDSKCSANIDPKGKEISYEKYESLFNTLSQKNDALFNSLNNLNLNLETKLSSMAEKEKKINTLRELL